MGSSLQDRALTCVCIWTAYLWKCSWNHAVTSSRTIHVFNALLPDDLTITHIQFCPSVWSLEHRRSADNIMYSRWTGLQSLFSSAFRNIFLKSFQNFQMQFGEHLSIWNVPSIPSHVMMLQPIQPISCQMLLCLFLFASVTFSAFCCAVLTFYRCVKVKIC